ncbi:MAG: MFS transporter [Holosporales bacterium]|jgi:sugar phosphate permease|nr:MFS transporter [Holosporales bacterium]
MSFPGFCFKQASNTTETTLYKYWRFRMMFSMMLGYAAFYFVRQNLSFAMPLMEADMGLSKTELGQIASIFGVIYGLGKFISGILGDRSKSRTFISVGLLLASVTNIFMSLASSLWALTLIWAINSCCQSTGAPSCAKMIAHWFSPKEIGTKWAIWSSSQQIGAAIISVILPLLLFDNKWRIAFWGPGILGIIVAAIVYFGVRDEPKIVGLPSPEEIDGLKNTKFDECAHMTPFQILVSKVIRNKMVWTMGLANFFLYFVRMGFIFWGPMFLCQAKGCAFKYTGLFMAIFNIAGVIGSISAGILSDRYFKGRRGRAGFFYMSGLGLSMTAMLFLPSNTGSHFLNMPSMIVIFLIGMFVAGPQTMVGVAAVDFASKRAAGAASGLTGACGYVGGTTIAGQGIAYIASSSYGWNGVFVAFLIAALAGSLCFVFTWNTRAKALDTTSTNKKQQNIRGHK